jgi:hypothetical protein
MYTCAICYRQGESVSVKAKAAAAAAKGCVGSFVVESVQLIFKHEPPCSSFQSAAPKTAAARGCVGSFSPSHR